MYTYYYQCTPIYGKCRLLGYKNSVRTSQKTNYFSATEPNRFRLCKIWGFHGGDYKECSILGYKTQFVPHRRHITSPLQRLTGYWYVRFDVFRAVTMKNVVFWDIKTQFVLHSRHSTSLIQSSTAKCYVRFDDFTVVTMKNVVLWDTKTSSYLIGDTLRLLYRESPVSAMQYLMLSRRWLWRMLSSGMLRHVALVKTVTVFLRNICLLLVTANIVPSSTILSPWWWRR
jgi:hypothetical protein